MTKIKKYRLETPNGDDVVFEVTVKPTSYHIQLSADLSAASVVEYIKSIGLPPPEASAIGSFTVKRNITCNWVLLTVSGQPLDFAPVKERLTDWMHGLISIYMKPSLLRKLRHQVELSSQLETEELIHA